MAFFYNNIKWLMLTSGIVTASMFYALLNPIGALDAMFSLELKDPMALMFVRNWGGIVGMLGLLLIWGAFHEGHRSLAMVVTGATKVLFIALVFIFGDAILTTALPALVFDALVVLLFAIYLLMPEPVIPEEETE